MKWICVLFAWLILAVFLLFLVLAGVSFLGPVQPSFPWFLWMVFVVLGYGSLLSWVLRPAMRALGFA
jgi:hypothetical protein